jgi:hypothetical protein
MVNIAIMEAYSETAKRGKGTEGTKPYILSPEESTLKENRELALIKCKPLGDDTTLVNITDGNMESFFSGFSAAVDLRKPQKIDQIRISVRSANNSIIAGDNYELFYYDEGWRSAGKQKAEYNYLEYKEITSNTIYLLRNLNRGKEELAFIYRDGKQVFVNHDNINSIEDRR